ncbi:lysine--tRNA ligase [Agrococcus lahaulensis]|nr:lysine--tRNA ligase [Agrococcus lahaulensis]
MVSDDLLASSEADQISWRLQKREALLAAGTEAYDPGVTRTHGLRAVVDGWSHLGAGDETADAVRVSGRLVTVRDSGKLVFAVLQGDLGERLQLLLAEDSLGIELLAQWKRVVDIGDIVAVAGVVIKSRRGEVSVRATGWSMVSKAIRPLASLTNQMNSESRSRLRYLELITEDRARQLTVARSNASRAIRRVLEDRGYVEIDTPVLQLVHGGARARPFRTHFNSLGTDMTLRIALELNLKKAVVGGIERVYELGRIFRNEGLDATHSPEFTMLEAYEAFGDERSAAELTRSLILAVADALGKRTIVTAQGEIDLFQDWQWVSVHDAISRETGVEVTFDSGLEEMRRAADASAVDVEDCTTPHSIAMKLVDEVVEPKLIAPTFLHDYPAVAQPLARNHRSKRGLVEAWDLVIGGVERATGFTELVDPVVQREVLEEQSLAAAGGDPEAMQLDEAFLRALEYGAPPMGGIGIGFDRLLMMFFDASIRETQLFPHTRPEVS